MRRPPKLPIVAALCLVALAACDETMTTTVMTVPPPPVEMPAPLPLPAGPGVMVEPLSELPDPAVATCMSEVARVTGNAAVAPVSTAAGPFGQTVVIGVGEGRALWQCRVDDAGTVTGVESLGGGGA